MRTSAFHPNGETPGVPCSTSRPGSSSSRRWPGTRAPAISVSMWGARATADDTTAKTVNPIWNEDGLRPNRSPARRKQTAMTQHQRVRCRSPIAAALTSRRTGVGADVRNSAVDIVASIDTISRLQEAGTGMMPLAPERSETDDGFIHTTMMKLQNLFAMQAREYGDVNKQHEPEPAFDVTNACLCADPIRRGERVSGRRALVVAPRWSRVDSGADAPILPAGSRVHLEKCAIQPGSRPRANSTVNPRREIPGSVRSHGCEKVDVRGRSLRSPKYCRSARNSSSACRWPAGVVEPLDEELVGLLIDDARPRV